MIDAPFRCICNEPLLMSSSSSLNQTLHVGVKGRGAHKTCVALSCLVCRIVYYST